MKNLWKSIAVILFFCMVLSIASSAENYIVCESNVFTEFTVTLGDTVYSANVNTVRKAVSVEALAIKTGARALTKARIDYKGAVIDEIPSGSRIDLTNPVLCTVNGEQWKISVELSTVQRAVNFNNAGIMAATHANAYRRNAVAYQTSSVGGTNYGYWMNLGYAFDANGNSVEESTFGSITVKNKEMMNLTKTKAGEPFGIVSTAGDSGTAESTDKIVSELKVRLNSCKPNGKAMVKIRSGNVDWMTLSCSDTDIGKYYIGWQSASDKENNIVSDKSFETGKWYTLRMIFRKYPESETGYNVEIYADNEFICETAGKVTDSQGSIVKPEGCMKNGGKDTDFTKAQLYVLADKEAEFDMDIDDVYITAIMGNEVPADDSGLIYEFEKEQPPVDPDEPDDPQDEEKPSITEFDGILDKGFENSGEGWNINPYNIIPNSSFETDEVWKIGSSDKAAVAYTDEKARTGSRSAKMEYTAAGGLGAYRNYNIYEINPFSTYALGMSVITDNIEDSGLNAQLSFKTSSSNSAFDANKITDENGGYCKVTENYNDWHTVYDEFTPSKANEKYITQLAFRMNGKTGSMAYFDDLYFGTVERIEKYGETYKNYTVKYSDVNSGKGMLRLGAYNNLYGSDETVSIPLKIEDLKTYKVSAYAKADSASAQLKVAYFDKDGKTLSEKTTDKVSSEEWIKLEGEFTAPETASAMVISLMADGSGVVCFDDVDYSVIESAATDFGGIADKNLSIPQEGTKTFALEPYVTDQFGSKMRGRSVSLSINNPVEGISLTDSTVVVSSNTAPGSSVIITAESGELKKEYTITFSKIEMAISGADTITRKGSAVTASYNAYISENGTGAEKLNNDKVIWSIGSGNEAVSIGNDGTVTVKVDALLGKYFIKAVYTEDNTVVCEKEIEIVKTSSGNTGGGGNGSSGGSKNSGGTGGYVSSVTTPAAQPQKPAAVFGDVSAAHWAYEAITEFYGKGFVEGKSEGIFDPDGDITRAEFVKMAVNALGVNSEAPKVDFSDVPEESWAYEYISAAVSQGIINGYENNEFRPDDKITRQDIAVITYKAAKSLGIGLWYRQEISFDDFETIADYAEKAVTVLAEAGIINGMENNLFAPNETATRAQAVAVLQRIRTLAE